MFYSVSYLEDIAVFEMKNKKINQTKSVFYKLISRTKYICI